MKVSLITVSFNSEKTIEDTIRSVLSQDYVDIEWIVVDGGSSDNTISIIKKYEEKVFKLISEKDDGIYHALNKGISFATGDIIGILHSDDFYSNENSISKVVALLREKGCDAVYGDLQYVDRENEKKNIRSWKSGEYVPGMFLKGWMPPHPTFFVKRVYYLQYGVFNTSFHFAADYELMLRFIHKYGIRISYLPEVIVKMRTGGKSNRSLMNRIKANLEDRRAWKVNDLVPHWTTLIRKPLSKVSQFFSSTG